MHFPYLFPPGSQLTGKHANPGFYIASLWRIRDNLLKQMDHPGEVIFPFFNRYSGILNDLPCHCLTFFVERQPEVCITGVYQGWICDLRGILFGCPVADHCPAGIDEFVPARVVCRNRLYGQVRHGQYGGSRDNDLARPGTAFANNCDGHDWKHASLSFPDMVEAH